MKLTVTLSGHLKSLLPDQPKEIVVQLEKPLTVSQLATHIGITPWIIMSASINGQLKGRDYLIEEDGADVTLIGPMAGG